MVGITVPGCTCSDVGECTGRFHTAELFDCALNKQQAVLTHLYTFLQETAKPQ
jgi:hypothetical protein